MPDLDPASATMMKLYQRCAERKSLPERGGVLDQPEDLMRAFDVMDERLALARKKTQENAERDEELRRLKEGFHGRR